jgi:hypothetical protein
MNVKRLNLSSLLNLFTVSALIGFAASAQAADLAGCEANLKKVLCYTDPVSHWLEAGGDFVSDLKSFQNRKCLPAPQAQFKVITDVYETLPVEVQKAFCEMKRVYLVRGDVSYGALAEFYFEPTTVKVKKKEWYPEVTAQPTGYIMEISEKNRLKDETASFYTSRVFQQRFGRNVSKDGLAKDLPISTYTTPFGKQGALATTLIHEIGHMLSRAHRVTDIMFLPATETPWTKLTWSFDGSSFTSKHADDRLQSQIGLKALAHADIKATMKLFKEAGLPTLYAATGVEEEFAELFMVNFYDDLKWTLGNETLLDLKTEMKTNPAFKAKRAFIQKLLSSPKPYSLEKFGTISGELPLL